MKLHIIIDFMHIYYKYFFQLKSGKLKKLSSPLEWNGSVIEKDTSLIYYPLKDIEGIRKNLEVSGHDVTMSICFDMQSVRNDGDSDGAKEYKAGRVKSLSDEDYQNVDYIENLLKEAGHNVYRVAGYEADDLVNYLVKTYKDSFDYTVIYTNDKDLFVNICDNVGVMRFKQGVGYTKADKNSYEAYLEREFKVFIPYNAIGLFLSTVGDSADHIKGINKFGKVAFSKLITKVSQANNIDWTQCGDYDKLAEVVEMCKPFLTDEQFGQMKDSFKLVMNVKVVESLDSPSSKSSSELRKLAYDKLNMVSLIP